MIHFIIVSTVSMAVLLFAYHLLLENEKLHRFNRFFLLFGLAFSLVIPFISLAPTTLGKEVPIVLPTLHIASKAVSNTNHNFVFLTYILIAFYIVITAVLFIRFSRNIGKFLHQVRNNHVLDSGNTKLVLVKDKILPYTFFNYVFINKEEYEAGLVEKELYLHEQVHAYQKHTLDILFIELLKTVFWFNPILHYYKKAIQLNHEYLADEAVLQQSGNVAEYQKLLLEKAAFGPTVSLASSINFSITKKRFIMMTKQHQKYRPY